MSVDSPAAQPATPDSLIEQCLTGDQVAWEAIVRQNWRKVFNVAYKFVGRHDEAEDLTQDIFLKIFKALKTFDRRANFQTWIISISRNLCIDHYRSVRKERQTIAREVDTSDLQPASKRADAVCGRRAPGPARAAATGPARRCRSRCGRPSCCAICRSCRIRKSPISLGLPEGTVKSRINRGRLELARQLKRLQDKQPVLRRRRGAPARPRSRRSGVPE